MKRNFFFIFVTPKKEYIPQVLQDFKFDGRPIFCTGSDALHYAKFFYSYDDANYYMLKHVLPFVDTKNFACLINMRSISFE